MSDQYFKNKADEIEQKIHSLKIDTKGKCTGQDIEDIIYIGLKEVARDQRYACVALVTKHFKDDYDNIDLVCNTIQNAQIEKDK